MEYELDLEMSDRRMSKLREEVQDYILLAKQAHQNSNWNGVNAAVGMATVMATLLLADRVDKLVKVVYHNGREQNAAA